MYKGGVSLTNSAWFVHALQKKQDNILFYKTKKALKAPFLYAATATLACSQSRD